MIETALYNNNINASGFAFLAIMVNEYIVGGVLIVFGVSVILVKMKEPKEEIFSTNRSLSGWVAGLGTLVMGITIIIMKILGKL